MVDPARVSAAVERPNVRPASVTSGKVVPGRNSAPLPDGAFQAVFDRIARPATEGAGPTAAATTKPITKPGAGGCSCDSMVMEKPGRLPGAARNERLLRAWMNDDTQAAPLLAPSRSALTSATSMVELLAKVTENDTTALERFRYWLHARHA